MAKCEGKGEWRWYHPRCDPHLRTLGLRQGNISRCSLEGIPKHFCLQSKMALEIHGHHQTLVLTYDIVHCQETCEDTGRDVVAWTASLPQLVRWLLCGQSSRGNQDQKTSLEKARHRKTLGKGGKIGMRRHIEKVCHSITAAASKRPVTHTPLHSPPPQQRG